MLARTHAKRRISLVLNSKNDNNIYFLNAFQSGSNFLLNLITPIRHTNLTLYLREYSSLRMARVNSQSISRKVTNCHLT